MKKKMDKRLKCSDDKKLAIYRSILATSEKVRKFATDYVRTTSEQIYLLWKKN